MRPAEDGAAPADGRERADRAAPLADRAADDARPRESPDAVAPCKSETRARQRGRRRPRHRSSPAIDVLLIVENDLGFARFLLDTAREHGFKGIVTSQGVRGAGARARVPAGRHHARHLPARHRRLARAGPAEERLGDPAHSRLRHLDRRVARQGAELGRAFVRRQAHPEQGGARRAARRSEGIRPRRRSATCSIVTRIRRSESELVRQFAADDIRIFTARDHAMVARCGAQEPRRLHGARRRPRRRSSGELPDRAASDDSARGRLPIIVYGGSERAEVAQRLAAPRRSTRSSATFARRSGCSSRRACSCIATSRRCRNGTATC